MRKPPAKVRHWQQNRIQQDQSLTEPVPHSAAFSFEGVGSGEKREQREGRYRGKGAGAPYRENAALCGTAALSALEALAARVVWLQPSHHDPERFHVEKDLIATELMRLARDIGRRA